MPDNRPLQGVALVHHPQSGLHAHHIGVGPRSFAVVGAELTSWVRDHSGGDGQATSLVGGTLSGGDWDSHLLQRTRQRSTPTPTEKPTENPYSRSWTR